MVVEPEEGAAGVLRLQRKRVAFCEFSREPRKAIEVIVDEGVSAQKGVEVGGRGSRPAKGRRSACAP